MHGDGKPLYRCRIEAGMSRTPWNALIDACKEGAEGKCGRDVQVFFEVVEETVFWLSSQRSWIAPFLVQKARNLAQQFGGGLQVRGHCSAAAVIFQ